MTTSDNKVVTTHVVMSGMVLHIVGTPEEVATRVNAHRASPLTQLAKFSVVTPKRKVEEHYLDTTKMTMVLDTHELDLSDKTGMTDFDIFSQDGPGVEVKI